MRFRFGGKELYVSVTILPLVAFQIVIGETKLLSCAACALLLHECAHWIALRNLGYTISGISVYPFGAVMHLSSLCADTTHEWIAAAAGPLGSFLIASAVRSVCALFRAETEWLSLFYEANLSICAVNLLPAFPLDGGRIAKSVLLHVCSERHANRVAFLFTAIISLGFIGTGIYLICRGIPAWPLAAIGPFLLGSAFRERRTGRSSTVPYMLARNAAIREGRAQKAQIVAIHPEATIGEAVSLTSRVRYTIFYVTDSKRCMTVDENRILDAASEHGYSAKLKDAFDLHEKPCYNNLLKTGNQIGDVS